MVSEDVHIVNLFCEFSKFIHIICDRNSVNSPISHLTEKVEKSEFPYNQPHSWYCSPCTWGAMGIAKYLRQNFYLKKQIRATTLLLYIRCIPFG